MCFRRDSDGYTHLSYLLRRIVKSRSDILYACRRHQSVHPTMLICDTRDHRVKVLCVLHIDPSVVDAAIEVTLEIALRLEKVFCRFCKSVETVYMTASFDERFRECESEASCAASNDEDLAIELNSVRAISFNRIIAQM